jgi:hypothetical protein
MFTAIRRAELVRAFAGRSRYGARHYCRQESLAKRGSQPASRRRKNIRRPFGRGHDLGEGTGLVSAQNEPDPIRDAQFLVDPMQMNFHRAFCDPKLSRDNFICEPLRYQPGYFRFPSRQLMHSTPPIKLPRTTARTVTDRNERAPKSGAPYADAHITH